MKHDKTHIRTRMMHRRDALASEDVRRSSDAILDRIRAEQAYMSARVLSCFVSFRNEPDTHRLIVRALGAGKGVCVPLCRKGRTLVNRRIQALSDLSRSTFGLLEPLNEALPAVDPLELDLVIVPGLAFDTSGNRIGFGAGYYDCFLASTDAVKLAVAYDFQILDTVPTQPHDVPVDLIVTESTVHHCDR